MKEKIASGIMLTSLLISMALIANVSTVEASETIYIRPDRCADIGRVLA